MGTWVIVGSVLLGMASALRAATPTTASAPTPPVLMLWPGDPPATGPYAPGDQLKARDNDPNGIDLVACTHPSLAVYRAAADRAGSDKPAGPTPAVVICPGGAYMIESVTYEGIDVAKRCAAAGVTAVVLRYRLPDGHTPAPGELPAPQQDVLRALQLVRAHAAQWNVDPARVGVIGFSAGGHLAATAATLYEQSGTFADKAGNDAASQLPARPDFAVLIYPVISLHAAVAHSGSRQHLIGQNADAATESRFSADEHVTPRTPPMLIVQASDDTAVPPVHALRMATAAAAQRVPCELLLFSAGGHGFGLGPAGSEAGQWFDRMTQWMTARGVLKRGG